MEEKAESRRGSHWAAVVAMTGAAFVGLGLLFQRFAVLYDTDSYYHLAIARLYNRLGLVDTLPWARLSLLHQGFGDKELLFHVFLVPFAGGEPVATALAGRWALALLNAGIVAALAWLAVRAVGWWGLLLPWLVYAGSLEYLGRAIRLRPELLSLLLLLAATVCAGSGRYRLLGLFSALYALSYTAFHALLGLAFGWFVARGWITRRWHWGLLLYPVLGVGLGLLIHPHFPFNLTVWKVQSIDFFALKNVLDVGTEIRPSASDRLLLENALWGLGLLALWRSGRLDASESENDADKNDLVIDVALAFHVVTAAFGLLYLLMGRFSLYFIPFAALSVVWEMRRRGLVISPWVALPTRGRLPLAAVLLVLALGAGVRAGQLAQGLASSPGPVTREQEWAAFGSAVPPQARVAAEWGLTHVYMFWGPQGTYLNVLDPIFMAVPFPAAHRAERAVFEGREPDVALTLEQQLNSNFIAFSRFHPAPELLARLANDPRFENRYEGYSLLYEAIPERNQSFLLDWRVVPPDHPLPVPLTAAIDSWPAYPRAERLVEQNLEGFVRLERLPQEAWMENGCVALVHRLPGAANGSRLLELAANGPATLWLNERAIASVSGAESAVLGRGTQLNVETPEDEQRLTILACRSPQNEISGFYLREL